jgi:hypothetical protein
MRPPHRTINQIIPQTKPTPLHRRHTTHHPLFLLLRTSKVMEALHTILQMHHNSLHRLTAVFKLHDRGSYFVSLIFFMGSPQAPDYLQCIKLSVSGGFANFYTGSYPVTTRTALLYLVYHHSQKKNYIVCSY